MGRTTARRSRSGFSGAKSQPNEALAHPVEWYAEHGVDLRLGETIASLDDVRADTIVLATGARPRELPGATTFRTIDDSVALREGAKTAKTAVVVGGGFIGCELTASLTLLGVQVTQIVRDPMVFATLQAPPLSEALQAVYREHGVDLRLETSEIPAADLTVGGIGVIPNVELGQGRRPRGAKRDRRRRALRHRTARCLRDR